MFLHEQVAAEPPRHRRRRGRRPVNASLRQKIAAVLGVNTNTVLRGLRLLRDEGLLEVGRGRVITVAGTPERGVVLAKMKKPR